MRGFLAKSSVHSSSCVSQISKIDKSAMQTNQWLAEKENAFNTRMNTSSVALHSRLGLRFLDN